MKSHRKRGKQKRGLWWGASATWGNQDAGKKSGQRKGKGAVCQVKWLRLLSAG